MIPLYQIYQFIQYTGYDFACSKKFSYSAIFNQVFHKDDSYNTPAARELYYYIQYNTGNWKTDIRKCEIETTNAPKELLPKRGAVSVGQTTLCKFCHKQHLLLLVVTTTYSRVRGCLKTHFLYVLHVTGKSKQRCDIMNTVQFPCPLWDTVCKKERQFGGMITIFDWRYVLLV